MPSTYFQHEERYRIKDDIPEDPNEEFRPEGGRPGEGQEKCSPGATESTDGGEESKSKPDSG